MHTLTHAPCTRIICFLSVCHREERETLDSPLAESQMEKKYVLHLDTWFSSTSAFGNISRIVYNLILYSYACDLSCIIDIIVINMVFLVPGNIT